MKTKKMFIGVIVVMLLTFQVFWSVSTAHAAKQFINIACCTTGGSTFIKFNAMANLFNRVGELDVKATGVPTSCPTENLYLFAKNKAQMGLVVPSSFYFAYTGEPGPYADYKKGKLNFLLHMFNADSTNLHMAVLEGTHLDIKSPADFKGKSIGMGPLSSCGGDFLVAVLDAYNMTLDDIKPRPGPGSQISTMMRDGNVDVGTDAHGLPASAWMDVASTHKLRMIDLPQDIGKKIIEKHPYYWINTIEAGIYPYIPQKTSMLAETMACVSSNKLSENLVYNMMKAIWKNKEDLSKAHPAWKRQLEEGKGMFWPRVSPLHPGATKFYKELGYTEAELRPNEGSGMQTLGTTSGKKKY